MQKPVINLQLHQQPVVGGVFMRIKNWTTICWHNAFKSKSQHPALTGPGTFFSRNLTLSCGAATVQSVHDVGNLLVPGSRRASL